MHYFLIVFLSVGLLNAVSTPAAAAGLPAPTYNWTGFYIGAQTGGARDYNQSTIVNAGAGIPAGFAQNPSHGSGIIGGAYAGYNYQFNQIVVGVESEYLWGGFSGSEFTAFPNGNSGEIRTTVKWMARVTGRLGYAVDNWMFFGKGGWAWAGLKDNGTTSNPAGVLISTGFDATTRNGWTIGAGVEWGFAPNWSAKLEYDYADFGSENVNVAFTAVPSGVVTFSPRNITASLSTVTLGVAYRF